MSDSLTFPSEFSLDTLVSRCLQLRKGHALQDGCKAYTVIVDGDYFYFRSVTSLRKFLSSCHCPENFSVFRNFYKGVTINLNTYEL